MCCMYRKRSELFCLISTVLFVALNTEGSDMCFNCINCNAKLIQHRLIKFSCLKRYRINHAEMNKRMSKLSLYNTCSVSETTKVIVIVAFENQIRIVSVV